MLEILIEAITARGWLYRLMSTGFGTVTVTLWKDEGGELMTLGGKMFEANEIAAALLTAYVAALEGQ